MRVTVSLVALIVQACWEKASVTEPESVAAPMVQSWNCRVFSPALQALKVCAKQLAAEADGETKSRTCCHSAGLPYSGRQKTGRSAKEPPCPPSSKLAMTSPVAWPTSS